MSFEQVFGTMGRMWDNLFNLCSLHPVVSFVFFTVGFFLFMRYVFPYFMSNEVRQ